MRGPLKSVALTPRLDLGTAEEVEDRADVACADDRFRRTCVRAWSRVAWAILPTGHSGSPRISSLPSRSKSSRISCSAVGGPPCRVDQVGAPVEVDRRVGSRGRWVGNEAAVGA